MVAVDLAECHRWAARLGRAGSAAPAESRYRLRERRPGRPAGKEWAGSPWRETGPLTWRFVVSGWRDLNSRPLRPERSALPSCATPRAVLGNLADSCRHVTRVSQPHVVNLDRLCRNSNHKRSSLKERGRVNPCGRTVCDRFLPHSRLGAANAGEGPGSRLDRRSTRVAGVALTPVPGGAESSRRERGALWLWGGRVLQRPYGLMLAGPFPVAGHPFAAGGGGME